MIGQDTPLPSLELATEDMTGLIGACDVGFSCTYTNTISWRTPTTPLPMEINPRVVFDRLFGDGCERRGAAGPHPARAQHSRRRHRASAATCRAAWAPTIATRWPSTWTTCAKSSAASSWPRSRTATSIHDVPATPIGIPDDHVVHSKLMFDLMALAFQADITRISTFMMAREVSYRTFPQIGVPDPFHATSHHQDNPEKLEKLTKINTYHVSLIAYFLDKLKAIPDGDGTLLDHSLILFGSSMSNSNVHNHSPLPVFVAGGACGQHEGRPSHQVSRKTRPWRTCWRPR